MHRRPRPWQLLLVPFLALALLAAACGGSDDDDASGDDTADDLGDPGDCEVVEMAVSPEKIDLLTELAREFNDSDAAEVDGECVFVRPQRKSSGAAMQFLADGWPEEEGPRPVIWSPAGSTWGATLDYLLADEGEAPMAGEGTPFMLTPLVIAMPEPMAEALGWPDEPIGWADILALSQSSEGWAAYGHPEWGEFRLGKTNPNFSTSGLSALIAQTYAATGKEADLSLEDLNNPTVNQYGADIESAVVHYGDTTLTFLNNWYAADQRGTSLTYTSAAAVEEKSIIDYNRGNPDGVLDAGEEPRAPKIPLVAIYPTEGTLYSDNPFYILEADWVSDRQREGAERFQEFVQEPDNQEKVLEFGFRPGNPEVAIGAPIDAENGVDPNQPQTLLEVPSGEVLAGLLDFWDANRKSARVLLVMDVSGSMSEIADPETGATKLELARSAAAEALDQFKDEDLVGLRIFSTSLGEENGGYWQDLVPIAPVGEQRDQLESVIGGLLPREGTPLYAVTESSYQDMLTGFDPDRINAVILLTDGRNDLGGSNDQVAGFDELIETLSAESQGEFAKPVRVFPIAYGQDADLATLEAIAAATTASAYDASDPRSITKVFDAVVSNF
jgi:Ca-activated chloride channel family protein